MRKRLLIGFGAAIGAGAMYALDPVSGAQRRAMFREQALPRARRIATQLPPLAGQAFEQAQQLAGQAQPLAQQAKERVQPMAQHAMDKMQPMAQQAIDKMQPMAQQAKERVQPMAQHAMDKMQPMAQHAIDKMQPLRERASGPMQGFAARIGRTARGGDHSLEADDATLRDRVLSEVGHTGLLDGLSINVEQATVVVRGELVAGAPDGAALTARLMTIPGVESVEDLRHAHGTPAPSGQVSEHRAARFDGAMAGIEALPPTDTHR